MKASLYGFFSRLAIAACLLAWTGCDVDSAMDYLEPQTPASISAQGNSANTDPTTGWSHTSVPAASIEQTAVPSVDGALNVYFFDVGQGDATLLAGPNWTIVIDAGRHNRSDVVPLLQSAGVESIDLLIGTHPHADHIGQFPQMLETFPVREVWMCGESHTSRTFERALDAILSSGAAYHEPRAGESFRMGSALIEVLHPVELTGDLNESSIGIRVTFGQVSVVLTGDAEAPSERAMIQRGHNLSAQILRMGHHGSQTSSTPEFLQAVRPEVAIYSAGQGNSYGHPHDVVLQRLTQMGIPVLGTDRHGTIRVQTDGVTYQVTTERGSFLASTPGQPVLAR